MKKHSFHIILILSAFLFMIAACERNEPDPDPGKPDLPEEILILNHWIWDGMNDLYLWDQNIPDLDPDYQEDPEDYFYDLLYIKDTYSWIVDDYDALIAQFSGVSLSTGMSVRFGYINETQIIGILEYVTPDSPAEDSSITRGDIIMTIDGQTITSENIYDLYYQTTATFGFGTWNGTKMVGDGRQIELTAIELNQNPVVYHEVIDYQGSKTGYLVYTQFTSGQTGEWRSELDNVLSSFRDAGVSDVVVDLRYNPGGSLDLSAHLASSLAPKTVMDNRETFVKLVWNDSYNEFWKKYDWDEDGSPDGEKSPQLVIQMSGSDVNLDLSRVYFLTTDGTASASESLMTGLYPYMDVIQIGEPSYGKCYGSVTIDDWADPKRHNWAMQPIVLKYANADGFTDFTSGISPDHEIPDLLLYAKPFGSLEDPMLAKALELITGTAPPTSKSGILRHDEFRELPVEKNRMVERMIPFRPFAASE